MAKIIKDIKVLGEKDKLLILVKEGTSQLHMTQMTDEVARFMKNSERTLFVRGMQLFILKDGAEVCLAQALNDKLNIKEGEE